MVTSTGCRYYLQVPRVGWDQMEGRFSVDEHRVTDSKTDYHMPRTRRFVRAR